MYLSKISIYNYRGIKHLETKFDSSINIIIGENGSCKSALIDAIRLLYNIGNPQRDISVSNEDFYVDTITGKMENLIEITYEFQGLSDSQKGALYEFMILGEDQEDDYAAITISYEFRDNKYPSFSYSTGIIEGQKADYKTFELFQHYYLGALRDSTRDLLNSRNNVLGAVIKRIVDRGGTEKEVEEIMKEANQKLLERDEVKDTRDNVNKNLEGIFKSNPQNKIGLVIHQSKVEYIVNAIKPFLPHDKKTLDTENGFNLWQNSLGFNNLIYIATVLGDINERFSDDKISHFTLLIEEPEAHLHPQLQLNLFNFLKETNNPRNSQLFISTHSPTLTSKVPFENLILLDEKAIRINQCFIQRKNERIIENHAKPKEILNSEGFAQRQKQLIRFIDVTKSQLFYARSILMVEGISEELLLDAFAQIRGFKLEDYQIELLNIRGISFYPFLYLFNSKYEQKRLNKKVAIITDDDRCKEAKDYSFNDLLNDQNLSELYQKLNANHDSGRIRNIISVINKRETIEVYSAIKTFELEIALCNVADNKNILYANFFVKYLMDIKPKKFEKIKTVVDRIQGDVLTDELRFKIAILLWKILPLKADFAQNFALHILDNMDEAKTNFKVPKYIKKGFKHLIP